MAEFTLRGSNRWLLPDTYTSEDTVLFLGTRGRDTLFGGGGEGASRFAGTAGDDLYGVTGETSATVDYRDAPEGVIVDLTLDLGHRTFTDEHGTARTVAIVGMASDGMGGLDQFAESDTHGGESSITGAIGSQHGDVMNGTGQSGFFGLGGNDFMRGRLLSGGNGDDRLFGVAGAAPVYLSGDRGDDLLWDSDDAAIHISGGDGDDRILARGGDDRYVVGNDGDDFIDGGDGNDFIDGGSGADRLIGGAGSDFINPDIAFFQLDPEQDRDGDADVIRLTQRDLGAWTDVVVTRAFEEGIDEVRIASGLSQPGFSFMVAYEGRTRNPTTGELWMDNDSRRLENTVLQVDIDGDGFGTMRNPDRDDYRLIVVDAELTLDPVDNLLT